MKAHIKNSLADLFDRSLFWDVNVDQLVIEKHLNFIIARVLDEGHTEDIRTLLNLYTIDDIKHVITHRKNINPRTAYFWCSYFNIPYEQCKSLSVY
jgi:hypothetical protein